MMPAATIFLVAVLALWGPGASEIATHTATHLPDDCIQVVPSDRAGFVVEITTSRYSGPGVTYWAHGGSLSLSVASLVVTAVVRRSSVVVGVVQVKQTAPAVSVTSWPFSISAPGSFRYDEIGRELAAKIRATVGCPG